MLQVMHHRKAAGCLLLVVAQAWTAQGVELRHAYLASASATVDIEITIGGLGDTAVYVIKVRGEVPCGSCMALLLVGH
jgi:hypothetical protein